MRVDIAQLKKLGVSSGAYKKLFTLEEADRPAPLKRLYEQIRNRISKGKEFNLDNASIYAAIDLAYNAPFNQTTPTLVQNILSKNLNAAQTLSELQRWGISERELFTCIPCADGSTKKILNVPLFWELLIPVVKAYVSIRGAKLFNDRNTTPLLPYVPLKQSDEDRVSCQIVTDLIETVSTWMGYSSVMWDGILQALKYGNALSFPREEWYCERQVTGPDGKRKTVKEGLRYTFPHPTRTFFDLRYPLTTINSDTGIQYAGHWEVVRYSDILDERKYWNRKDVVFGTNWFTHSTARNFFQEIYPCAIDYPTSYTSGNDRDERFAAYSPNTDRDKPVFLTHYFEKLVPKTYGLADYDSPVWHRFVVAGDDVILWAAPCAYTPIWMMGSEYDSQCAVQSSMALECIPFQDHLGNILTDIILTAKQNLGAIIWYDTNLVNVDDIEKLEQLGDGKHRSWSFVPYDSLKQQRLRLDQAKAFEQIIMPQRDVNSLQGAMAGVLSIMERVLQMSAQEVGATAPHYQSAREITTTASATSNKLSLTGTFIDNGVGAWKQQLYDAALAYMDASVLAEVSEEVPDLEKVVRDIGFSITGVSKNGVMVKGSKKSLRLEGFARNATMPDRERDTVLSQTIYQTVGVLANNPPLFEKVGPDNVIRLLEEAAKLSGAPPGFKLPVTRGSKTDDVKAWVAQNMQQMQASIMQAVQEGVVAPIAGKLQEQTQQVQQLQGVIGQLTKIYEVAQQANEKAAARLQEAQVQTQIKMAQTQQDLQAKTAQTAQEIEMKNAQAQQDMAIKEAEFQADQARKQQEHEAQMVMDAQAAAVKLATTVSGRTAKTPEK